MKSKVTNTTEYCIFCGREASQEHHLIFGTYGRAFSDKYGLIIPVCPSCHVAAEFIPDRIHDNTKAEALSKMLGQAIWEKNYYKDLWYQLNRGHDEARERFIELNGMSYL